MNKQKPPHAIEWTRVYGRDGYTWNAVQGCLHGCQWEMPTGEIAECYAKTLADKFRSNQFMNQGFEHHYFQQHKLEEPLQLKTPAGIFVDSFSDLFGTWVPDEQISTIMNIIDRAHWHTFQSLTKNAPRLLQSHRWFAFPKNLWVGASVPPSRMMGKPLSNEQQTRFLHRTLDVLEQVQIPVRWLSIEPLSFDVAPILAQHPGAIQWAVIGAATNGKRTFQPKAEWVANLLAVLDAQKVPVFFKGNLTWSPWREHFPAMAEQLSLF